MRLEHGHPCFVGLLLFLLLIVLVLLRRGLSVVICEVDLFRELDTKLALLNPRRFRLKLQAVCVELFKHIIVHARNHVWGLNEGEGKGGLEIKRRGISREAELNESVEGAESLLLRKDVEKDGLLLVQVLARILRIVLLCSLKVFFCL